MPEVVLIPACITGRVVGFDRVRKNIKLGKLCLFGLLGLLQSVVVTANHLPSTNLSCFAPTPSCTAFASSEYSPSSSANISTWSLWAWAPKHLKCFIPLTHLSPPVANLLFFTTIMITVDFWLHVFPLKPLLYLAWFLSACSKHGRPGRFLSNVACQPVCQRKQTTRGAEHIPGAFPPPPLTRLSRLQLTPLSCCSLARFIPGTRCTLNSIRGGTYNCNIILLFNCTLKWTMNDAARRSARLCCCCQIKGEVPYKWQGEKPRGKVWAVPQCSGKKG